MGIDGEMSTPGDQLSEFNVTEDDIKTMKLLKASPHRPRKVVSEEEALAKKMEACSVTRKKSSKTVWQKPPLELTPLVSPGRSDPSGKSRARLASGTQLVNPSTFALTSASTNGTLFGDTFMQQIDHYKSQLASESRKVRNARLRESNGRPSWMS
jgi:hypothetical protein